MHHSRDLTQVAYALSVVAEIHIYRTFSEKMERWSGRVALVTGGSSGIGSAVVRRLVSHGLKVVACGRQVDKIQVSHRLLKASSDRSPEIKKNVNNIDILLNYLHTILYK